MEIKVLGSGCPSCKKLEKLVHIALEELGKEALVSKVTEYEDILAFGVMSTPALVVDGVVKLSGHVPSVPKLKEYLK